MTRFQQLTLFLIGIFLFQFGLLINEPAVRYPMINNLLTMVLLWSMQGLIALRKERRTIIKLSFVVNLLLLGVLFVRYQRFFPNAQSYDWGEHTLLFLLLPALIISAIGTAIKVLRARLTEEVKQKKYYVFYAGLFLLALVGGEVVHRYLRSDVSLINGFELVLFDIGRTVWLLGFFYAFSDTDSTVSGWITRGLIAMTIVAFLGENFSHMMDDHYPMLDVYHPLWSEWRRRFQIIQSFGSLGVLLMFTWTKGIRKKHLNLNYFKKALTVYGIIGFVGFLMDDLMYNETGIGILIATLLFLSIHEILATREYQERAYLPYTGGSVSVLLSFVIFLGIGILDPPFDSTFMMAFIVFILIAGMIAFLTTVLYATIRTIQEKTVPTKTEHPTRIFRKIVFAVSGLSLAFYGVSRIGIIEDLIFSIVITFEFLLGAVGLIAFFIGPKKEWINLIDCVGMIAFPTLIFLQGIAPIGILDSWTMLNVTLMGLVVCPIITVVYNFYKFMQERKDSYVSNNDL